MKENRRKIDGIVSRREEYEAVERERIAELLEGIDDLGVLGRIYKIVAMLGGLCKGGGAA